MRVYLTQEEKLKLIERSYEMEIRDYRVEKYDAKNDRWLDYGRMPLEDAKLVIKGYKKNNDPDALALFGDDEVAGMYTRKGSRSFFSVEVA